MAESLAEACRELRKRLGKVQEDFAREQGWRLNSVSRYERGRPPAAPALRQYLEVAQRYGFSDLAQIFRERIIQDEGLGALPHEFLPQGSSLVKAVAILLEVLHGSDNELREELLSIIERASLRKQLPLAEQRQTGERAKAKGRKGKR